MLESDRLISTQSTVSEEAIDRAIRPLSLSEYIGQEAVRLQMQIFIDAAKKRNDALDHVLIFGRLCQITQFSSQKNHDWNCNNMISSCVKFSPQTRRTLLL